MGNYSERGRKRQSPDFHYSGHFFVRTEAGDQPGLNTVRMGEGTWEAGSSPLPQNSDRTH